MTPLIAIQRTLWIIGGYTLAYALADKPKDWRLWTTLVCMAGMIFTSIFME